MFELICYNYNEQQNSLYCRIIQKVCRNYIYSSIKPIYPASACAIVILGHSESGFILLAYEEYKELFL